MTKPAKGNTSHAYKMIKFIHHEYVQILSYNQGHIKIKIPL